MRRTLLASLVLHVFAIALLLTIRAPEPLRVGFARVTPIASPYRMPIPGKPQPRVRRLLTPHTAHAAARTFRVPDSLPQLASRERTPVLADPPSIQTTPISVAAPVPKIPDLPPPRPVVVAIGAFGDASTASPAHRPRQNTDAPISSAAEILSKPRPAYTEEARRLRIEGEVLLEVLFAASGDARVLRTIRGLGHGLDENAILAAGAIQFRPAKRGDAPADSTGIVHIVFQLAY